MIFDPAFALSIIPVLGRAAVTTVEATLIGYALALVLGLSIAIGRIQGWRWLRWMLNSAVEFIRSTPLLVQLFFLYYVAPRMGLRLAPFEAGVIALGVHYGAYNAEIFRSGLENLPRGQWEAAGALGLTRFRTFKNVVLPQILPPMVPALGNYFILMFKDTPLLSAVSVLEIMQVTKLIGSETFRYVEPMSIAAMFFVIMSLGGAAVVHVIERHTNRNFRESGARRSTR
jgi:polar amino acid transport system permease protein